MSLTIDTVKKIAHLARLNVTQEEADRYTQQLSNILELVEQMNQVNTEHIEPYSNPFQQTAMLRADVVTESNQRDVFQAIAPLVEAGLYLVPQVIEGE